MARKGKKAEKREAAEEEKIGETRYSLAAGRTLEFRRCTAGCRCSNSPEGKIKTQYPRKDAKGQRGSEREGLGGRGLARGKGKLRESAIVRMHLPEEERKAEKTTKRQSRVLRYVPCKTIFPSVCLSSSILFSSLSMPFAANGIPRTLFA